MWKLRLERTDISADELRATYSGRVSDGWLDALLAEALTATYQVRLEYIVAKLISQLFEFAERHDDDNYWDGYNSAIDSLIEAASKIIDGWDKHDKDLDKLINQPEKWTNPPPCTECGFIHKEGSDCIVKTERGPIEG